MMRWLVLLCLPPLLGAGAAAGQERAKPRPGPPCATVAWEDRVAEVLADGDLRLASGTVAKLSSVRLPDDADRQAEALAWLRARAGQPVGVAASAQADRWGRVEARLTPLDPPSPHLAQSLVAQGLAIVDAGEAETLCWPELLGVEAAARQAALGVWSDRRYKPLAAGHVALWRERVGRFVLVEGSIRSIGERRQRTYLNLGPSRTDAITVTVPKRIWSILRARGLTASVLQGRRIRARGLLEEGRGPVLDVIAAEAIEIVDQERTRR
jgi:endonuclease YncB( thermonuclease family)